MVNKLNIKREMNVFKEKAIRLSAIGWVEESNGIPVKGCRLRWLFPALKERTSGESVGFPEEFVVERAPYDEIGVKREWDVGHPPTLDIPDSFWRTKKKLEKGLPLSWYLLEGPAQAIHFLYKGPSNVAELLDSDGVIVIRIPISDGQHLYYEAPDISHVRLIMASGNPSLKKLSYINLFKIELDFKKIAKIACKLPIVEKAALNNIAARLEGYTTLTEDKWSRLRDDAEPFFGGGSAFTPEDIQEWYIAASLRWEYGVLAGFGYFDGPRTNPYEYDDIDSSEALKKPPPNYVLFAYRITSSDPDVSPSNVIFVPSGKVSPLKPLDQPKYEKLSASFEGDGSSPLFTGIAHFVARLKDVNATGGEVDERLIADDGLPQPKRPLERFIASGPRGSNRLVGGVQSYELPNPGTVVEMRARAYDKWDRVSSWSQRKRYTFEFHHWPLPPELQEARYDADNQSVTLIRKTSSPDWTPDTIVASQDGFLEVLRATENGRVESYGVVSSRPVSEKELEITLAEDPKSKFIEGGRIIFCKQEGRILAVNGKVVLMSLTEQEFWQCQAEASLGKNVDIIIEPKWEGVVTVSKLKPLPKKFTVKNMRSSEKPLIFSFACLIGYRDFIDPNIKHYGPKSNIVQAIIWPQAPRNPDPFTVTILGRDFFGRLGVRIEFTKQVDGGSYLVAWSSLRDGIPFKERAIPGALEPQRVHNQKFLYDVLDIPESWYEDQEIEIGIKRISDGGLESDFTTVTITLEAS